MSDPAQPPADVRRVLIIDDEAVIGLSCERILSEEGYSVHYEQDPLKGMEQALTGDFEVILLDIVMPEVDGLEVLRRLKSRGIPSEIVMMTGYATIETAVEAMKLGAKDFVSKPFTPDDIRLVVKRVMEHSELVREIAALRRELQMQRGFEGIIGESRQMQQVFSLIRRVAPTDGTVLIHGESGTGKEMAAKAIHRLSRRRDRVFIACDCSALAPTLLASELFGHVKGSFSGAISTKEGLFEAAHQGTLFLDEVSNISLETQGTLLRVLETRLVKKVGDTQEREVDIRLIAATNRDLLEMVREGSFREDLYYRLNVVPVHLPPLRERTGDIPRLVMVLLDRFSRKTPTKARTFSPEALARMESYPWPGNVRELKNAVERMAILTDSERIEEHNLPAEIQGIAVGDTLVRLPRTWSDFKSYKQQVQEAAARDIERRFLVDALRRCEGNVSRAAEDVGMQRTQFHALLRKYGLSAADVS